MLFRSGPDDALALVARAGVTVEKLPEALTVEALQHNITRLDYSPG